MKTGALASPARRRRVLFGKAIALALLFALGHAGAAAAGISDDEIRIGVITDLNGIYSELSGQGSVVAAEMAVDDANREAASAPVRIFVRDTELDPEKGLKAARELYEEHNVDMITGIVGSDVALAVQDFATKHDIAILHSGPSTTRLTGEDCSPLGIQWGFDNYALSSATVSAIIRGGGKRWFFITADYAFGHDLFNQASEFVERNGGKVVGNALTPYQGTSFASQIQEALLSDADVIALANAGADLQKTIREGYELGMNQSGKSIVALDTYITDIRRLGLYVTHGLKYATSFYWDATPKAREWSDRFMTRTGTAPTLPHAGVYSAVTHYLEAVDATGSDEAKTVVKAMRERPVDDFYGRGGHIRPDGQMAHDMYLMQVKSSSESEHAWDYLDVVRNVPAEQAFRPLSQSKCPRLDN